MNYKFISFNLFIKKLTFFIVKLYILKFKNKIYYEIRRLQRTLFVAVEQHIVIASWRGHTEVFQPVINPVRLTINSRVLKPLKLTTIPLTKSKPNIFESYPVPKRNREHR